MVSNTDNLITEITKLQDSQTEMKHMLIELTTKFEYIEKAELNKTELLDRIVKIEHLTTGIDGQNGLRGKQFDTEKRIDLIEKQYASDKSTVMGWIKGVGLILILVQLLPQIIKLFSK